MFENRDGWLWRSDDIFCWKGMNETKEIPQIFAKYADKKRVIVQAGGNCGFYIKQYAELFDTVYTFEPDYINFLCLCLNVQSPNVFKYQACLGDKRQLNSLTNYRELCDTGNMHITSETAVYDFPEYVEKTKATVPTMFIDDLALDICDMIQLDVEGYELFALKGAINTIKKCRPVIIIEYTGDNGHTSKYNYKSSELDEFIISLNYKFLEKAPNNDRVYVPNHLE